MGGGKEGHAIANLRRVIRRAEVEDVRGLNFLELCKRFLQFQICWIELRLVQQVVDRLSGDRIAQSNFDMHERPRKSLASSVVELGRCALVLEIRKSHEGHLR